MRATQIVLASEAGRANELATSGEDVRAGRDRVRDEPALPGGSSAGGGAPGGGSAGGRSARERLWGPVRLPFGLLGLRAGAGAGAVAAAPEGPRGFLTAAPAGRARGRPRRTARTSTALLAVAALAALAGCRRAAGYLGDPCYPNATCEGSLVCVADVCTMGSDAAPPPCGDGLCEAKELLTCPADCCVEDCTDRECGDDGCGGSCGTCPAFQECGENGACRCTAGNPVDCGEMANGCWPAETDCRTVGFCSAVEGCVACMGTDSGGYYSWCCAGGYTCCAAAYPFACSDGLCYPSPADCPGTLCGTTSMCAFN